MTRYYMHHVTGAVYTMEKLELAYHYQDDPSDQARKEMRQDIAQGIWFEVEPKIKDADESNPNHWISVGGIVAAPQ